MALDRSTEVPLRVEYRLVSVSPLPPLGRHLELQSVNWPVSWLTV